MTSIDRCIAASFRQLLGTARWSPGNRGLPARQSWRAGRRPHLSTASISTRSIASSICLRYSEPAGAICARRAAGRAHRFLAGRREGPSGAELVAATADAAIDASVRSSYAAFSALINDWSARVRRWRCGLSAADQARLALPANWRCNDLVTFIDRVNFDR
jgi:hypothetical protein